MRRDILLGMILAAVLHFSVAIYSSLAPRPGRIHVTAARNDPVTTLVLPPLPPEIDLDTDVDRPDTPPPLKRQEDLPQPVNAGDFLILPEPPRPPVTGPTFVVNIPTGTTLGAGRAPFRLDQVDRAPQPVLQVPPAYPAAMRTQHVTGEVVVRFVVDADNSVRDVRVVSSSDRAFESAAVQAVQKWKFKAGLKGSKPVPVLLEIPIRFQLK